MFNFELWKLIQSFLSFLKQLLIAHWRSLLMLLIGVYVPLQVVEELAVEVWKNEGGFPWDEPILLAIHNAARAQLDVFAVTLTKFGASRNYCIEYVPTYGIHLLQSWITHFPAVMQCRACR